MAVDERKRVANSRRYVLGGGPGTAGRLRDLSSQAVADWYGPLTPAARRAADDLALLVTELVAHAVRHGGTPYELRLDRSVDGVWLQVSDTGAAPPRPEEPPGPDPSWHSLRLVQRLAAVWGWVPRDGGRTLWCEVRFPPADGDGPPSEGAADG
ncbi:ATP-binding protein [Streptomyces sp. NPDC035033]|uniref:ATP-binding protein n=1 Tax=Streptomyces sp. NPDC035033 TaxID=3155368 RepID=UPI0033ECFC84